MVCVRNYLFWIQYFNILAESWHLPMMKTEANTSNWGGGGGGGGGVGGTIDSCLCFFLPEELFSDVMNTCT